jgi:hypothetical protein
MEAKLVFVVTWKIDEVTFNVGVVFAKDEVETADAAASEGQARILGRLDCFRDELDAHFLGDDH